MKCSLFSRELFIIFSEWYDEWCLVENPYFHVNEMDCWPCGSVNSVQDLTHFNVTPAFNTGISFLRNGEIFQVDLQKLQEVYTQHKDIFLILMLAKFHLIKHHTGNLHNVYEHNLKLCLIIV